MGISRSAIHGINQVRETMGSSPATSETRRANWTTRWCATTITTPGGSARQSCQFMRRDFRHLAPQKFLQSFKFIESTKLCLDLDDRLIDLQYPDKNEIMLTEIAAQLAVELERQEAGLSLSSSSDFSRFLPG